MESTNPWWRKEKDQSLENWSNLAVKWIPQEIDQFSLKPFALNFLSGSRQVGKTTLLSLLIHELLQGENKSVDPRSIFYFSCDELTDYKELAEVLDSYLNARSSWGLANTTSFIFLDEVTFVDEWWRAVKSRIDNNVLSRDVVTVTGSASLDLLKHREYFPGRRGTGVDLTLRPLGFRSYVRALQNLETHTIKRAGSNKSTSPDLGQIQSQISANKVYSETLDRLFLTYLETGGFPLAVKEKIEFGHVQENSRKALLDGLRVDFLRTRRSEKAMKEVISYLLSSSGSPISWLSISKSTSLASPNTCRTYVETLNDLLLVLELDLIRPDFKVMHRKNKKIHFADPFIYNVLSKYTGTKPNESSIVEGTVASHLSREYDTFYWRNGSEVDIVAVEKDKAKKVQHGVEVKWGFKKGIKPRHISNYLSIDRETVPSFLASLPFA